MTSTVKCEGETRSSSLTHRKRPTGAEIKKICRFLFQKELGFLPDILLKKGGKQ